MKDETKKMMDEYVEKMYPLIELLDIHNLNTEQLVVTPIGEEFTDGKVYFQIERGLTDELKKILTEAIMSEYGENEVVYDSDTYYIVYDSCDKLSCGSNPKEKGGIGGFAIKRNETIYLNDIVGDLLFCMSDSLNIKQAKNKIYKCADECYDAILHQLRKLIPTGEFIADIIVADAYIHHLQDSDGESKDYIIGLWQNTLVEKKEIKWVNFMDINNMFIALKYFRKGETSMTNEIKIRRGDIVWVNFGKQIGSEQSGIRPALVIQNNKGNEVSPTIIVCAITSQPKRKLPTHVELIPDEINGLTEKSTVLVEQTRTIDRERIIDKCGWVDGKFLAEQVNRALTISLGLLYNNGIAKANC